MGKTTGFTEFGRAPLGYRPAEKRKLDYLEIYNPPNPAHLVEQSARCMDCGVPFCQSNDGCPLRNTIPEWNHHTFEGDFGAALRRLEQTNNFPEFTGRVCPAPCEGACVLGLHDSPVTIREIEFAIAEYGWEQGLIQPRVCREPSGKSVGIVGSGPAGLAAAQQLTRLGHKVVVYEREDHPGGLLTYGIPNMKLEKGVVDRRLEQLALEGVSFRINMDVGKDLPLDKVLDSHDAVLLAIGACEPRDIPVQGRDLRGIHFAMDFLTASTKAYLGGGEIAFGFDARGRHVAVIGAGDTATDCIATAVRQDCASIVNIEIASQPPALRAPDNAWPAWPKVLRTDYGHYEAIGAFGEDPRRFRFVTQKFLEDRGCVCGVVTSSEEGETVFLADMVLIAAGFVGPEGYLLSQLGIPAWPQKGVRSFATPDSRVFMAGDCRRGQSLVVWAIEEGREAARCVDGFLKN